MGRLIFHEDGGVTLDEAESGAGYVPYADLRKSRPSKPVESEPVYSAEAKPRVGRQSGTEALPADQANTEEANTFHRPRR